MAWVGVSGWSGGGCAARHCRACLHIQQAECAFLQDLGGGYRLALRCARLVPFLLLAKVCQFVSESLGRQVAWYALPNNITCRRQQVCLKTKHWWSLGLTRRAQYASTTNFACLGHCLFCSVMVVGNWAAGWENVVPGVFGWLQLQFHHC